jgi:ABC-2 type transport system ATP-binding protein
MDKQELIITGITKLPTHEACSKVGPVVITDHLTKHYGKIEALKDVSLRVDRGVIFGLLGQNGSGKTTLVKILLGITRAAHGSALLLGEPIGTASVRRKIGYLPEDHRFPDYHTGASLLDFYASLLEVPRRGRQQRINEVLELVGLQGRMHSKIRTYSKGMKQRLGIAQAIIHHPEAIFLDEPTDGVDPVGRREIRTLLQQLKEQGVTIFLNSHLLSEVELICDRVGILQRGELIREGTSAELTQLHGRFVIVLAPDQDFPRAEVSQLGYQISGTGPTCEVTLTNGQSIDPLIDCLRNRGLNIRHMTEKRQSLEDVFLELVTPLEHMRAES